MLERPKHEVPHSDGECWFCDRGGCNGSCNQLSTCETRVDNVLLHAAGHCVIQCPAVLDGERASTSEGTRVKVRVM